MSYDRKINPGDMRSQPATTQPARPQPSETTKTQDHYDDGLVHGHFWAKSTTTH